MKRIVIASGKGGTGKTSITASLCALFSEREKIVVVDCDIDAPNLHILLDVKDKKLLKKTLSARRAIIDYDKCNSCRKCVENICVFNAISWSEKENKPVVDELLCEGCGACSIVCPQHAIKIKKVSNGKIYKGVSNDFPVFWGGLNMGETGSGKIVTEVKQKAEEEDADYMIIDSAAGVGCPVIASCRDSDYAVLVAEPTPPGFSDMKKIYDLLEHFSIKTGLIINKHDINKELSKSIEKFAEENDINIIGRIKYDKKFVQALVNLKPIVKYDKSYRKNFSKIVKKVQKYL